MEMYFDLVPVALAVYCLFSSAISFPTKRRKLDKAITILSAISAILLIFAQTSWWTNALTGTLQGTVFANSIWSIFNSTVMIIFILFSRTRS